jgi:hypothetical protein
MEPSVVDVNRLGAESIERRAGLERAEIHRRGGEVRNEQCADENHGESHSCPPKSEAEMVAEDGQEGPL